MYADGLFPVSVLDYSNIFFSNKSFALHGIVLPKKTGTNECMFNQFYKIIWILIKRPCSKIKLEMGKEQFRKDT